MLSLLAAFLVGCGQFGEVGVETGGAGFSGCDGGWEDTVASDFAAALEPDGCQYRVTAVGDSLRVLLDVPAFAAALADGSASATYTLPEDAVRLTLEQGCNLEAGWCEAEGSATIFTTYTPTAGTVTVSAAQEGASGELLATVTFEGVTLVSDMGADVAMDPLTWTDVRLYGSGE